MRSVIAAAAALALSAGAALAQDRPVHSGAYVGLVAGYATSALQAPGIDLAAAGAQGGVMVGYGITGKSGMYLGAEVDALMRDIKWSATDGTSTVTASNQWMGSMRLRAGQAIGPMLLYVTGGAALTDQKVSISGLGSDHDLRWGWVGGAGIESHVTQNVALRVEGLYYNFPDKAFWTSGDTAKIGVGETVVRVGVVFKLQ